MRWQGAEEWGSGEVVERVWKEWSMQEVSRDDGLWGPWTGKGRTMRGERLGAQVVSIGKVGSFCILLGTLIRDSHLPADSA